MKQIVKVGTNTITKDGKIHEDVLANVVLGIVENFKNKISSVLVTSWAVGLGKEYLWANRDPEIDEITYKQMCSGAGQAILMECYRQEFGKYGLKVAQVLVTQDTLANEKSRTSLLKVIEGYLRQGIVPIINENDVLSTEELEDKELVFPDNDILAQKIGVLLRVHRAIFLSNVAGLSDKHPDNGWVLITKVDVIDEKIYAMVEDIKSAWGKWWMKSKIRAAEEFMKAGIPLYLADGREQDILQKLARGEQIGTVFAK